VDITHARSTLLSHNAYYQHVTCALLLSGIPAACRLPARGLGSSMHGLWTCGIWRWRRRRRINPTGGQGRIVRVGLRALFSRLNENICYAIITQAIKKILGLVQVDAWTT
jgi:hypothetical protein